jgi:hypothetical protein
VSSPKGERRHLFVALQLHNACTPEIENGELKPPRCGVDALLPDALPCVMIPYRRIAEYRQAHAGSLAASPQRRPRTRRAAIRCGYLEILIRRRHRCVPPTAPHRRAARNVRARRAIWWHASTPAPSAPNSSWEVTQTRDWFGSDALGADAGVGIAVGSGRWRLSDTLHSSFPRARGGG